MEMLINLKILSIVFSVGFLISVLVELKFKEKPVIEFIIFGLSVAVLITNVIKFVCEISLGESFFLSFIIIATFVVIMIIRATVIGKYFDFRRF